jgi:hypothetical protein
VVPIPRAHEPQPAMSITASYQAKRSHRLMSRSMAQTASSLRVGTLIDRRNKTYGLVLVCVTASLYFSYDGAMHPCSTVSWMMNTRTYV